jgi:hypothetical protein
MEHVDDPNPSIRQSGNSPPSAIELAGNRSGRVAVAAVVRGQAEHLGKILSCECCVQPDRKRLFRNLSLSELTGADIFSSDA